MFLQSDGFFDHALGTSAGSLSPRTKWQELAKYEFVLPPIAEQHRIVELIQTVDELVDSYRTTPISEQRNAMGHHLRFAADWLYDDRAKQEALFSGTQTRAC